MLHENITNSLVRLVIISIFSTLLVKIWISIAFMPAANKGKKTLKTMVDWSHAYKDNTCISPNKQTKIINISPLQNVCTISGVLVLNIIYYLISHTVLVMWNSKGKQLIYQIYIQWHVYMYMWNIYWYKLFTCKTKLNKYS